MIFEVIACWIESSVSLIRFDAPFYSSLCCVWSRTVFLGVYTCTDLLPKQHNHLYVIRVYYVTVAKTTDTTLPPPFKINVTEPRCQSLMIILYVKVSEGGRSSGGALTSSM